MPAVRHLFRAWFFDMGLPKRKLPRLKGYDYSVPGAYFVTVCAKEKKKIFGQIHNGEMQKSQVGEIAEREILKIDKHYSNVKVDKYVVMPNHIHMLITVFEAEGINPFPTICYDIPNVVGKFKAAVTRKVGNAFMHSVKEEVWQRSFHDHIIRNRNDYEKIWYYIDTNVLRWEGDCFFDG